MRALGRSLLALVFLMVGVTLAPRGDAQTVSSPKIGQVLRARLARKANQSLPVLVMLKRQADLDGAAFQKSYQERRQFVVTALRREAQASQGPLLAWLTKHGLKYQRFYISNMIAVANATPALIQELAARDDVARVLDNAAHKNLAPVRIANKNFGDRAINGVEANILRTGAARVWQEFKDVGSGIVIAGQDTGVEWQHPALKTHYRGWDGKAAHNDYNWHDAVHGPISAEGTPLDTLGANDCGYDAKAPCDDNGHGSHTMGTMIGDDGSNHIGMAPGAKWMACRNMDRGTGQPSSYLECFEFFLAPYPIGGQPLRDGDPRKAPDIINNSWGCGKDEGCEGDEFSKALSALKAAGIMVVVSAGNDGADCGTIKDPPAYYSKLALTVGAFDHRNDTIADFSSRGPSVFDNGIGPSVVAPGVAVRSSVPHDRFDGGFLWSGTSMAGPHVAGEVALLWAADPSLRGKIDETIAVIEHSATAKTSTEDCGTTGNAAVPNNTYGYGLIDAFKAVSSRLHH